MSGDRGVTCHAPLMTVWSVSAKKQVYRCTASARVASPRCMAWTWHQRIWIQHKISFPTDTNTCLSGNVESWRSTSKFIFNQNIYFSFICLLFFKVSQVRDTLSLTWKRLPDMHVHIRKHGAPFGYKHLSHGQFYLLLNGEIWCPQPKMAKSSSLLWKKTCWAQMTPNCMKRPEMQ